jgi:signal peptidase II
VVLTVAAVLVYAADQLAKAWALAHLSPDVPRDVVGSALRFNLTRNAGAAFSIGTGATWILTLIAASVVVVIIVSSRRLGSRGWAWALGLLLGGSVGNLTDRLLRPPGLGRGHVVDFVQLPHWPIFNVADSAIVTAAVLIGLLALRGIGIDGTHAEPHTPKHEAGAHHDA